MAIQVGSRVRIIGNATHQYYGMTGVVKRILALGEYGYFEIGVVIDGKDYGDHPAARDIGTLFRFNEVEETEQPMNKKFAVGDKVRVIYHKSAYDGCEGVIHTLHDSHQVVKVAFNIDNRKYTHWFSISDVRLVEDKAPVEGQFGQCNHCPTSTTNIVNGKYMCCECAIKPHN